MKNYIVEIFDIDDNFLLDINVEVFEDEYTLLPQIELQCSIAENGFKMVTTEWEW